MTRAQAIELVGKNAVKQDKDEVLVLTTAPRPHGAFEVYSLAFSPKEGLLRIRAVGRDIRSNDFGSDVRDGFTGLMEAVSTTYGTPRLFDFLQSGSMWNEDREWMMGLLKKERTLQAVWCFAGRADASAGVCTQSSPLPNHITLVYLKAEALSTGVGYLTLEYEFEGWDKYVDAMKAKAGAVF
jgi:hypothetical protein